MIEWFWLRSPNPDNCSELSASPSGGYVNNYVGNNYFNGAVRSASNLNLSSVLFASAAEAGNATEDGKVSTLTTSDELSPAREVTKKQDAMTLRMNGEGEVEKLGGKTIGVVKTVGDTVEVTKGTIEKTVTLIIQGKDGDTDWYYAKTITKDTTVPKTDITGHTDVNLADCKIWLEAEGTDEFIYAVKATTEDHEHSFGDEWTDADGGYHWKECTDPACPVTDKGKSETIVAHDYGNEDTWFHSSSDHYKKCIVCDKDESIKEDTKAKHTFGTDGKCTVCKYDIGDEHNFKEEPAKAATCTKPGNNRYWYCDDTGCDVKWRDGGVGILIELGEGDYEKYIEIPTTPHTFSGNKCTVCGYTKASDDGSSDGSSSDGSSSGKDNTSDGESSSNGGTTYSDGSSKNSDRSSSSGSSSGGSGGSSSGSTGSGTVFLSGGSAGITGTTGTGWMKDSNNRWWYYDTTYGKILGWVFEKTTGKWYYVDANNGRLNGWFHDTDTGYWYYLDDTTGAMLTGWQTVSGKQYYFAPIPPANTYSFNTSTAKWYYENPSGNRPYGSMYANTTTPDNHSVDADGAKIK